MGTFSLDTSIRVMVVKNEEPSQLRERYRAICMNAEDFMVFATGFHIERAMERLQRKVRAWSVWSHVRIVNFDELDDDIKKDVINNAHEKAKNNALLYETECYDELEDEFYGGF